MPNSLNLTFLSTLNWGDFSLLLNNTDFPCLSLFSDSLILLGCSRDLLPAFLVLILLFLTLILLGFALFSKIGSHHRVLPGLEHTM